MLNLEIYQKQFKSVSFRKKLMISLQRIIKDLPKRLFDIFASSVGLILLSPFFAVIAWWIKRDSLGPVFYWGPRMGRDGRVFKMLKFRTMYEDISSYNGPRVTAKGDIRITPLGQWLRDTKLNELPQLWNVFIGEMSLVGPRPEDPQIAKDWPEAAKAEVLSVRPGVTSPASILYHDEEGLLSATNLMGDYLMNILPDKMRLDRLYVHNRSFFTDIDVIFWTVMILVPRLARRKIPERYLFAGPFSRLVNRYLSWFVIDLLVVFFVAIFIGALWQIDEPLILSSGQLFSICFLVAFVFSSANWMLGLNRILWERAKMEDGLGLIISSTLASVFLLAVNYLQIAFQPFPFPALPLTLLFMQGILSAAGFVFIRYRLRVVTGLMSRWLNFRGGARTLNEHVLIVGSGENRQIASWLLRNQSFNRVFTIAGVVDDENPAQQGMRVDGSWVLGSTDDIPALITKYDIGVVLIAVPNISIDKHRRIASLCRESNVRIIYLADILDTLRRQLARPLGSFEI